MNDDIKLYALPTAEEYVKKCRSLFARVLVKKVDPEIREKTISGIILTDNTKEMPANEGIVLSVGKGCEEVKVGDYVWWGKHAGAIIRPKGTTGDNIIVMQEEDLLIIEEANNNG